MGDISGNGKETKARRTNQRCDNHNDGNGDRKFGCNGTTDGGEPLGVNHPDRARANLHRPGNTTTGGMLRQLIAEEDDQLADFDVEIHRLQQKKAKALARRDRYIAMLNELEQRIKENP